MRVPFARVSISTPPMLPHGTAGQDTQDYAGVLLDEYQEAQQLLVEALKVVTTCTLE